jgi:hypothetical protein
MIITWILIILTMLCGIGGAVFAIIACETKVGKICIAAVSIIVAIGLSGLLFWHLYYTESGKRAQKTFHSEVGGGLYRTVKVYDMQGEQIAEYKGKFDVEENQIDGVTKIKFDLGGERHIIYCSTGTVIIDEISTSKGSDIE